MPTMGIIGFGRFGQLWAGLLRGFGPVLVYDIRDRHEEAARLGVSFASLPEVAASDVLFFSVPISITRQVMADTAPYVHPESLVADVCTVKSLPAKWLQERMPDSVDLLPMHPLFGPDSARNGLAGLQVVVCPIRVRDSVRYQALSNYLAGLELEVIESTPDEHDRQTAYSLTLPHFVGRGLERMDAQEMQLTSQGYERLLRVKDTARNDSRQLFLDMQQQNPYASASRRAFRHALLSLEEEIVTTEETLPALREAIDQVDEDLVFLLNQRAKLARRIGAVKRQTKQAVKDRQRERQVIARALERSSGPLPAPLLEAIFEVIIAACRGVQE